MVPTTSETLEWRPKLSQGERATMAMSVDEVVAKAEIRSVQGDPLTVMLSLYLRCLERFTKSTFNKATEGDRTEIYQVVA